MEFEAILNLLLFTHLSFQDDSRVYGMKLSYCSVDSLNPKYPIVPAPRPNLG